VPEKYDCRESRLCPAGKNCRLIDADRQKTVISWAAFTGSATSATLLEATPEDRYPGMMWITQIKALAEECEMIIIDFPSGLE